jgi:hypothetical protein
MTQGCVPTAERHDSEFRTVDELTRYHPDSDWWRSQSSTVKAELDTFGWTAGRSS